MSLLKRNNWLGVKIFIFLSLAIPLAMTTYELTVLGKDSVLFLGNFPSFVGSIVLIYYLLLLLAGITWGIVQLKSLLQLKNERSKNELLHLQSQVNPHFFFNMLNNLYGMVDTDVEQSKQLILKLSNLMRYSIYEGQKTLVSLQEEVAYLQHYLELHQLRYHKKIDIQFDTHIADKELKVMPLLFIILVENAFKHGVENLREGAYVHLRLSATKNKLNFEIENNFDPNEPSNETGIGLKNLQRRLALAYPQRHQLTLEHQHAVYTAKLELYP